ncbi:MAG: hypothetical protein WC516_05095 [Patescibacteria group bacterium]|jgi:hypothetical protein
MSKIIFEDLTQEVKEIPFEEEIITSFAGEIMQIVVQTGMSLGLSPKEIVYSMFLLAENLKRYGTMTGNGNDSDYEDIYTWSQSRATEWAAKVKASGIIEKVKETVGNLYKKKSETEE